MKKDTQIIVNQLSAEEKAALVSGHNFMYTNAIPSIGLPALECADGPHGLRKQMGGGDNGVAGSLPSTAFPTAATTACGWNRDNLKKIGEAIAEECRYYGVDVLLGPAVNIKKNPLCGRNFEYFSEDPLLTAEMGKSMVDAVQSKGVGVSVKHFAANSTENYRFMGNSVVDERALREIYLKAFESIVKNCNPASLMCAYNQINGEFCSENKRLLTDILRGEWNFDGVVMTDWGAVKDRIKGVTAGLDLEMPGDTHCRDEIIRAVKSGVLSESALDEIAGRMVEFVNKWHRADRDKECDFARHHALAAEIAADCAVLMKNDDKTLPLASGENVLVTGELFEKMRYQGSGSSMISPTELVTPRSAFDRRNIRYDYVKGYSENKFAAETQYIEEAVAAAANYEKILIFAGLTDYYESEGGDRENMRLPENQCALINALARTGKRIALVLFGGSPVELPFADDVSAILNMYLPGQNGGEAVASLLFGDVNPGGKLAETWVKSYSDVPFGDEYGKKVNELYKESIFVGYRYYLTAKKKVRYPFGYGLSYTKFDYADMRVEENGDSVTVRCKVTNTGERDGAEIVQLYIGNPAVDGVYFAERELRAFDKVYLKKGETKEAVLSFSKSDLRFYNTSTHVWTLAGGAYTLYVSASVEDVRLSRKMEISGEVGKVYSDTIMNVYGKALVPNVSNDVFSLLIGTPIPAEPVDKPITLETRLDRYKKTFFGRTLYKALTGAAKKMRVSAKDMPEGAEKDNLLKGALFLHRIMSTNSIRTLSMSAGRNMPYHVACGFVELANGHWLKGLRLMKKRVDQSKLPADKQEL